MDVVIEDAFSDLKLREALDLVAPELDPETGRAGDGEHAVVHFEPLDEDVVRLERVVRVAREDEVRAGRDDVGVRGRRDAELCPAADRAPLAGRIGESGDVAGAHQPACLRGVDDEHVARVRLDQLERRADARTRLVGGDRHPDRAAHLREALHVEVGHGLLDVLQVEALEAADPLDRGGNAPDHVRVDPELDVGADPVADRRDRVVVLAEVPSDLELELGEPGVDERRRLLRVRLGLVDEQVARPSRPRRGRSRRGAPPPARRAPCP